MDLKRENFALYIGDINANKNLSTLLKAVALIPHQQLVLAGKAFLDHNLAEAEAIRREVEALELGNRVTYAGYISEEEKVTLLNRAKVYVQPSIYEGFGLPVLEALACGTPVICGNNSSLAEVTADAATFANITDPADLADKITYIKKTGREVAQAKKFSWEKTAQETYEVYQSVLGGD